MSIIPDLNCVGDLHVKFLHILPGNKTKPADDIHAQKADM